MSYFADSRKKGDGVDFLRFFIDSLCYKVRKDAPGALQHNICRSVERAKIFTDAADKNYFVVRLGRVIVVRW